MLKQTHIKLDETIEEYLDEKIRIVFQRIIVMSLIAIFLNSSN